MVKYDLALSTGMHFSVDGICAAVLMTGTHLDLHPDQIIFGFCLYNLIAFGTQFLVGLFLDKYPKLIKKALSLSWILLILGALPLFPFNFQALTLGCGNSLFHVAAGSLILRRYQTCRQLGLFVSSGAIGLALGLAELVPAIVFIGLYSLLLLLFKETIPSLSQDLSPSSFKDLKNNPQGLSLTLIFTALLLMLCVTVRGFGGNNPETDYVLLFPLTYALGKVLGGVCCDYLGYRRTILLIFLLSFLALQAQGLLPSLVLILSFNMTMPLTLRLLHWCNINKPGLMFGLAAGCLLPGFFFMDFMQPDLRFLAVGQFLILVLAGYLVRRPETQERMLKWPN